MGGMGKHMEHHTGMPGGMHDALHEAAVTAFGLAGMKAELGLSTQQEAQLRQAKEELLKKGQEIAAQITAKRGELNTAASAGKNAEVKQFLDQVAGLEAQRQYAVFETAGKMKTVLTAEQRAKIATHEVHHAMMMHMTMGEMQQMMQFMGSHGMGMGMMGMGPMGMRMMGMPAAGTDHEAHH